MDLCLSVSLALSLSLSVYVRACSVFCEQVTQKFVSGFERNYDTVAISTTTAAAAAAATTSATTTFSPCEFQGGWVK